VRAPARAAGRRPGRAGARGAGRARAPGPGTRPASRRGGRRARATAGRGVRTYLRHGPEGRRARRRFMRWSGGWRRTRGPRPAASVRAPIGAGACPRSVRRSYGAARAVIQSSAFGRDLLRALRPQAQDAEEVLGLFGGVAGERSRALFGEPVGGEVVAGGGGEGAAGGEGGGPGGGARGGAGGRRPADPGPRAGGEGGRPTAPPRARVGAHWHTP